MSIRIYICACLCVLCICMYIHMSVFPLPEHLSYQCLLFFSSRPYGLPRLHVYWHNYDEHYGSSRLRRNSDMYLHKVNVNVCIYIFIYIYI